MKLKSITFLNLRLKIKNNENFKKISIKSVKITKKILKFIVFMNFYN